MDTPLTKEEFSKILKTTLKAHFDDFALMVGKGFANTATKVALLATKEEVALLANDVALLPTMQDLGKMEHRIRDYADTKFDKLRFDIQGDIVTQSRKEDMKLVTLIEILKETKIISERDAKALLEMEPFPRSMI